MFAIKEILKKIDFGDIDGLFDPNLEQYFIEFGYEEKIISEDIYFVIGRKGTGKSALYSWVDRQQSDREFICTNMPFKEFPFEKLLKLSDDDFSQPNQYQSIWRNILYSEFSKLISI